TLGWTLAQAPDGFATQTAAARALLDAASQADDAALEHRDNLKLTQHDLGLRLKQLRTEIEALEAAPNNIPGRLQDLRKALAEELNLPLASLPFVGELMKVRDDQLDDWGGAAERLLHGFGQDLVVEEKDQRRVARWVDQ